MSLHDSVAAILTLTYDDEGRLTTPPVVPANDEGIGDTRRAFGLPALPAEAALLRERQVYLLRLAGELRRRTEQ